MRIKIVTKAKKAWSDVNKQRLTDATLFAMEQFNIKDVSILLKLVARKDLGSCVQLEKGKFVLHLSAHRNQKGSIKTLFHELTHLKQYVCDGFDMYPKNIASWKGKVMKIDETFLGYWNSPWEQEARAMEKKLWRKYRKTIDYCSSNTV
jgi:hypothetical protein